MQTLAGLGADTRLLADVSKSAPSQTITVNNTAYSKIVAYLDPPPSEGVTFRTAIIIGVSAAAAFLALLAAAVVFCTRRRQRRRSHACKEVRIADPRSQLI